MKSVAIFTVLALGSATLRAEKPNRAEAEVRQRTGADALWLQDAKAREQAAAIVAKLLKKPLTVSSAVQIALLNNRNLQATFEEIGIARADVIEAVTLPNPSVEFEVQFPVASQSMNRYAWLVAQEFVQILMIPLKKRISEEQLEAAEMRVAAEILETVANVKKSYFDVQADQQLLSRLKTIQDTTSTSLDLGQKQYEAGNITDLALLQMQATYNDGRLEIAQAATDLQEHREDLNALLGLWGPQTAWKIEGDILPAPASDFSTKHLESLAVAQRLDLRASYRELTSVISALGLTKTFRWVPVLDMGFSGERDIDGALNMGPQFRLELPIFNQGQARIARGQSELRRAESRFEALAVGIRSDVRKFRDKLASLSKMATFYHDQALPARIRIVNKSLLEYNAMQIGPYQLFMAKADELKVERGYIETLRAYWATRAELERTVGGTLTPRKSSSDDKAIKKP